MKPHNREQIATIFNQIKKAMRKKQEKKNYSAPSCMIIQVNENSYLMNASMPGQHKKANHGTGPSSAKVAPAWQEGNEDAWNSPSWED